MHFTPFFQFALLLVIPGALLILLTALPRIVTLNSAAIYIYADDHNRPHFNLLGPDTDCNIRIETFEVYEGEATRQALSEANKQILRDKWREYNERG
jgi:hypothetical protein